MRKLLLLILVIFLFSACNNAVKSDKKVVTKDTTDIEENEIVKTNDPIIDSITQFKPVTLSIPERKEMGADMDQLIPVGYNDHGSFAYLIDQNMGGSAGYEFHITPAYDLLNISIDFDREGQGDSVFYWNRGLIREALQSAKIKLNNSIQRTTLADLEKNYGIKFNIKKSFGLPNKDYDENRKTLASLNITYGNPEYPSEITNDHYDVRDVVWDKYISDVILVPSKELGMFGYIVLVTESLGFEGYTRKQIHIVSLGSLNR